MQGEVLQDFVINKIDDLKGQDTVVSDVQGRSNITDRMIIRTGAPSRHVMSITDRIVQELHTVGPLPLSVKDENSADQVVMDLGDVTAHAMQEGNRRLYEPEKLWS